MKEERINTLRHSMENKGIDSVLLASDVNRNYISGFTGSESYTLVTLTKAIFITDSRYLEQARNEVKNFDLMEYSGDFLDTLEKLVIELDIKKLGLEDDYLPFGLFDKYAKRLKASCVSLEGILEEQRIVKDEDELNSIRKAAAIADKGFTHMLNFIKEGMTEREIGLELEFYMKKKGARDLSFTTIVASGVRSSLPHGQATDKKIKKGDFLTLDFGCIYNDYCSDMTRTIVIGKASEKMLDLYDAVLQAQENVIPHIKPGALAKDIDKVARDYIASRGYGEYFGHGLGHGVGRQIHEAPLLNKWGETILKAGMVVTDEPGIYIPDFGGTRIEDLIIVTDNGCEVVSKSPKDLIII